MYSTTSSEIECDCEYCDSYSILHLLSSACLFLHDGGRRQKLFRECPWLCHTSHGGRFASELRLFPAAAAAPGRHHRHRSPSRSSSPATAAATTTTTAAATASGDHSVCRPGGSVRPGSSGDDLPQMPKPHQDNRGQGARCHGVDRCRGALLHRVRQSYSAMQISLQEVA